MVQTVSAPSEESPVKVVLAGTCLHAALTPLLMSFKHVQQLRAPCTASQVLCTWQCTGYTHRLSNQRDRGHQLLWYLNTGCWILLMSSCCNNSTWIKIHIGIKTLIVELWLIFTSIGVPKCPSSCTNLPKSSRWPHTGRSSSQLAAGRVCVCVYV